MAVCSEEDYKKAIAKGEERIGLMTTDRSKTPSRFSDFPAEFSTWGWHDRGWHDIDVTPMLPEDMSEGKSPYEISAAMKKMNISTDKKHWVAPEIAHRTGTTVSIEDQTYMVNGRAYRMTDAKVGIAINHTDGVLVVGKAYGPVFRGQKRTPPVIGNDLPQLKKLSDVLWGQWTICHNQFHTNLSNVRCIFLYMLENEDSKKILLKAIRKYKDDNMAEIGEWPAVISIPADCEAGKAILGMPIAACASYFLSDHQNVLGKKKITRFDIYWVKVHEVHEGGPNVICHVGNA